MFDQTEAYARLRDAYRVPEENSFGLFLGAGVNLPTGRIKTRYATYTWSELLEALYIRNRGCFKTSFDALRVQHGDDWPLFAQTLIQEISDALGMDEKETVKYVAEQLDHIIHCDIPRGDKYRRLAKRFLDQAPTLHAALCFSARIRKHNAKSWTFERNCKIGAVITMNYDFFFGAGWTRYQTFDEHWKVQTPFSEGKLTGKQKPIYCIHGYLPYQLGKKRKIVLKKDEYDEFYAAEGFARKTLGEAVRKYNLIFIGTSFTDKGLCDILQDAQDKSVRQHFAIVRTGETEHVKELGVCRVEVGHYSEIATVLEKVYCSALDEEEWRRFKFENPECYWKRLKLGPRGK